MDEEKDKKPEKKERKKQHIIIDIIERKGQSALVEWPQGGDLRRAYVPASKIKDAKCDEDVLNAGLPFGVPWEELIDASGLTPGAIAMELRRRGIWTSADIERNPKGVRRAVDAATGLTMGALHGLAAKKLVNYQPYDYVTLTEEGAEVAQRIVRRHAVIKDFLVKVLGVAPEAADDGACKMEHAVRGEILERLVRFLEFLDRCPRGRGPWVEKLSEFCEHGADLSRCESCLSSCLEEIREKRADHG